MLFFICTCTCMSKSPTHTHAHTCTTHTYTNTRTHTHAHSHVCTDTDEATAREFVNPYQLEAESSSDDDEELNSLQRHKTPSPSPAAAAASTGFPPPVSFVDKPHLEQALQRPSAQKPTASSTFPRSISSSEALQEFRGRSESEEPVGQKLQPLGEEGDAKGGKGLSRRGAMSTKDKDKYTSSKKRVAGSIESSGGSSLGSFSPPMAGSPYHRGQDIKSSTGSPLSSQAADSSGDMTEQLRRQLANPPPKWPPPQLVSEVPQKPVDGGSGVEVIVEPPTPSPLRPGAAVHRRKKERGAKVNKPLEDEFKKVAVGPSSQPLPPPSKKPPVLSAHGDEFKKLNATPEAAGATHVQAAAASKPPPPSKPAPIPGSDEFQKVTHKGGVTDEGTSAMAAAAGKPPPPNKPAPIHESDEFTKITPKTKPPPRVTSSEEGEFRKANASSAKEPPSRKLPAVPPPADEFRKVHPKPAGIKKDSPPPPPADEFRKVYPKPVEVKKDSPPPPVADEFRKVYPKPAAVKKESPALPPPADEFRKVYSKPTETKENFPLHPSESEFRKVHSKPAEVRKSSFPSEAEEMTAKPVNVKKPIPLPRTEIDEFRKVKHSDTKEPPTPPRTELGDEFQRVRVEADATSTSDPSLTATIRAEKGQTPPSAIPVEPVKQESPRSVPVVTPRSKLPKGDEDNKSILSTSSLASQSSRSTPPREFHRDHSPASDQLDVQSRRGLPARQEGIDDNQALPRFRIRSGAMKSDAQRRSGSPAAETTHHQPHKEYLESRDEVDSDDFLPRARSRSGAIDSRSSISSSSSRGGSTEPQSSHGDSVKPHVPLDWKSSQEESAGSSEDVTQPRMRTRSRAFHGRPPSTRGKQEELISTSTEEDSPHPRMRTRSRAYHGDSQRPKGFARSRSPAPQINEAQSVQDPQSSLEIPQSRPSSSSMGQSSLQQDISSGRTSPSPKPDGEK